MESSKSRSLGINQQSASAVNQFIIDIDVVIGSVEQTIAAIKGNMLYRFTDHRDNQEYFSQTEINRRLKNCKTYKDVHDDCITTPLDRYQILVEKNVALFKEVGAESYCTRTPQDTFNLKKERMYDHLRSILDLLVRFKFAANYILEKKDDVKKFNSRCEEFARDFLALKAKINPNIKFIKQMLLSFPSALNSSITLLDEEARLEEKAKYINENPMVAAKPVEKSTSITSSSVFKAVSSAVAAQVLVKKVEPLFTPEERKAINAYIDILKSEIDSFFAANKELKQDRVKALEELLGMVPSFLIGTKEKAIDTIITKYPNIAKEGAFSNRMLDLFADLKSGKFNDNVSQLKR